MTKRRTREVLWTFASIFGVMTLGGAVGAYWWWGAGFDEAEAFGRATPSTDAAMVASLWISAAGFTGLMATGVLRAGLRGRTRS